MQSETTNKKDLEGMAKKTEKGVQTAGGRDTHDDEDADRNAVEGAADRASGVRGRWPSGANSDDNRYCKTPNTVDGESDPLDIESPPGRNGGFEPPEARKRQREWR